MVGIHRVEYPGIAWHLHYLPSFISAMHSCGTSTVAYTQGQGCQVPGCTHAVSSTCHIMLTMLTHVCYLILFVYTVIAVDTLSSCHQKTSQTQKTTGLNCSSSRIEELTMGGHIAHHTPCKSSNSAIDYAGPLHLKDPDAKMDKARDENGRIRLSNLRSKRSGQVWVMQLSQSYSSNVLSLWKANANVRTTTSRTGDQGSEE